MTDPKKMQFANAKKLLAAAQATKQRLARQREAVARQLAEIARQVTAADAQVANLGQLVKRLRAEAKP